MFEQQGDVLFQGAASEERKAFVVEHYEFNKDRSSILKHVQLRDGGMSTSAVSVTSSPIHTDLHEAFDSYWLRQSSAPTGNDQRGRVRIVDLFSGCGALSVGIVEACRALSLGAQHVFASDINPAALSVYRNNFATAAVSGEPAETLVGRVGSRVSAAERQLKATLGDIDVLAGGPPCQGHSDLNNHTRRHDPRNSLFEVMIRFAQLFEPKHVVIENVPGVKHDAGGVTENGKRALLKLGYRVSHAILTASEFGAAQRRRRYFLVATRGSFDFDALARVNKERTLRWACEDLIDLQSDSIIDSHAASAKANRERIDYLFDHDLHDLPNHMRPPCHRLKSHSYNSVYGRLKWDAPAPTITSGFNSPGQGRFVHPQERRTLTPHEAARLQSIPDFFNWGTSNREALTQMIGNAVPPKLAYAVALEMLR